jgi:hypothetical protein
MDREDGDGAEAMILFIYSSSHLLFQYMKSREITLLLHLVIPYRIRTGGHEKDDVMGRLSI